MFQNQQGITPILQIFILVIAIGIGVFFIGNRQIFSPKASAPSCIEAGGTCINKFNKDFSDNSCVGGDKLNGYDCPNEYPYCYKELKCFPPPPPGIVSSPYCASNNGICLNQDNKDQTGKICTGGEDQTQLDCPDQYPICIKNPSCSATP